MGIFACAFSRCAEMSVQVRCPPWCWAVRFVVVGLEGSLYILDTHRLSAP